MYKRNILCAQALKNKVNSEYIFMYTLQNAQINVYHNMCMY